MSRSRCRRKAHVFSDKDEASSWDGVDGLRVLLEMSQLLNTGLDAQSLALCVKLCETGANPEALANLIKELRARTAPNVTTWSLRPEHAER
ncbi:hypothetical protein HPB49_022397 [Dermacentor silvarum]|uniref:Uncharacterized protein n=1 Tax=Dermacentor silvarum TaxID=543639 RepID=A0ACB8DKW8_DERSI|nr:hypothetical protein HPB49_022397 [Dermacentor silvarum]